MNEGFGVNIKRLQHKQIFVKSRKRGVHKGARRSAKSGTSIEFSDFRSYQPGDDIRLIDWNIYGRTGKHYIKRFLDEQEIHVAVFLDATPSMQAVGAKWKRAKEIAAAMAYIALSGEDRLTFIPVSAGPSGKISRKGSVYGKHVYTGISLLDVPGMNGAFTENLLAEPVKNIHTAIVISDGLEEPDAFQAVFRKFAASKVEVKFIQLLSAGEMEPELSGDVKLVDSETGGALNVTMQENVLALYRKRLIRHNEELEAMCKRFGFTHLLVTDAHDLQDFLFHICPAKKVLE